ncbi:hypothetical protein AB4Z42_11970 [Mycobacterium sp. 2YAF39]|uniref:hypothetical protein n=1 Tax=Mycobacterium sp. 2YAF39 TaxID=3233033 RepID=UPI003F9B4D9F
MRTFVASACVICAIAAFGLSLWTYMDVSMFGFPDGYVTDYQKAADTPLTIITWVSAGLGLLLLALAFSPIGSPSRAMGWLAALIVLVILATAARVGVPWYFGIHLGLDNGVGG